MIAFGCLIVILHSNCHASGTSYLYDASGNQISQKDSVAGKPVITSPPINRFAAVNGNVGFSVVATSAGPVTYQWLFKGQSIDGATGDSYFIPSITTANVGLYSVIVTNASGSTTSSAANFFLDGNGNGLPDTWETTNFGNLNQTAGGDYDGDDISNVDEYYAGTNPKVRETYFWIAASGEFNNAANWSRNRVPKAGDNAVVASGTFTLPSFSDISKVTISVPYVAPSDAEVTLEITGNWSFNGGFTLANGQQFSVKGGGNATVTSQANLNGSRIVVYGTGTKLSFPNVTTYTQPQDQNVSWTAGWGYDDNSGCELNFPALTTITGSVAKTSYYVSSVMDITAQNGAKANFPVLKTLQLPAESSANFFGNWASNGLQLRALNSGEIHAVLLNAFNDRSTPPQSSLTASDSGKLDLPKLLAPLGIQMNLNDLSNPQKFTSMVGTYYFELNAGTVALPMTNINALTTIYVHGTNTKLSFPNVTSYVQPQDQVVAWTAGGFYMDNTGCELNFPQLKTITGSVAKTSIYVSSVMYINAQIGATINFPALTSMSLPAENTAEFFGNYPSDGIRLLMRGDGTINAGVLTSFLDQSYPPQSFLTVEEGTFSAPGLLQSGVAGVTVEGITLPSSMLARTLAPRTNPVQTSVTESTDDSISNTDRSGGISSSPSHGGLVYLCTRMDVQTGNGRAFGHFIIEGNAPKQVAIRALGPSLANATFPVHGTLTDPQLEIYDKQALIGSNDNWQSTQRNSLVKSGLSPANSSEAAILLTLNPGDYTVIVSGKNSGSGIAQLEIFDLDPENGSTLMNLSTQAHVGAVKEDKALLGGIIIEGATAHLLIVRGLGPSLASPTLPVARLLANPLIEVRNQTTGELIDSNDDWENNGSAIALRSAGLPLPSPLESGLQLTLTPGNYTFLLRHKDGSSQGIGTLEIFDLGPVN